MLKTNHVGPWPLVNLGEGFDEVSQPTTNVLSSGVEIFFKSGTGGATDRGECSYNRMVNLTVPAGHAFAYGVALAPLETVTSSEKPYFIEYSTDAIICDCPDVENLRIIPVILSASAVTSTKTGITKAVHILSSSHSSRGVMSAKGQVLCDDLRTAIGNNRYVGVGVLVVNAGTASTTVAGIMATVSARLGIEEYGVQNRD